MSINKISKLTALAGFALLGTIGTSHAATVSCPGVLGGSITRQITVTGALAGGECYYQTGNFLGDDVSPHLGANYTQIDKDIAPNDGAEGGLLYTFNDGRTAGTWTMSSNFWNTYAEIFIGFHFGNGSGDPDGFIVELDPGALTGTWALTPEELANGLSNIYLWGRGTATSTSTSSTSTSTSGDVPEPGSLTLLGLGLLGLGAASRRRVK